jgi:hypothetical protein
MEQDDTPWTMSVPECGLKYFGLKKNASYEAAKRGDIPVMRIGGLLKALPRVLEARLSKETEAEDQRDREAEATRQVQP